MTKTGGSVAHWQGDDAYLRLIDRHGAALLHLAILLTGNRHDAEDVVQDTIIAVAAVWSDNRPRAAFAYLKKAVTNRAINLVMRRRETPTEEVPDRAEDDLGFLRFEEDRRFFRLVEELPLKQRATLVLRYYADMDDRTIAELLDCSVQTVRSQAHHGLAKLRANEHIVKGARA